MNYLCLDFVNSSWYITHKLFYDPLRNYEWMKKLLLKWDIDMLPEPDKDTMDKLDEMRRLISDLLGRLSEGSGLRDTDIDLINKYMAYPSFYRQLSMNGDDMKLKDMPTAKDWSWFMCEVATSLTQLLTDDNVKKLKTCKNPECKWFFIDESRSSNRKWCDDTCANLMKVRRFRKKQRESGQIK